MTKRVCIFLELSWTSKNETKKQKQKHKKNPKHFIIEQNISNLLPTKPQSPTETLKWYKKEKRKTLSYFFFFLQYKKNWLAQYHWKRASRTRPSIRPSGWLLFERPWLLRPMSRKLCREETDRQGDRQDNRQTEIQKRGETDRQKGGQMDRQTDRRWCYWWCCCRSLILNIQPNNRKLSAAAAAAASFGSNPAAGLHGDLVCFQP